MPVLGYDIVYVLWQVGYPVGIRRATARGLCVERPDAEESAEVRGGLAVLNYQLFAPFIQLRGITFPLSSTETTVLKSRNSSSI